MKIKFEYLVKINMKFIDEQDILQRKEEILSQYKSIDRIEGALRIQVNSKVIMGLEEWDLIGQLFCYILNESESILKGLPFSTYLPDQPLLFKITALNEHVIFEIGMHKVTVPRKDFYIGLFEVIFRFFEDFKKVFRSTDKNFEYYYESAKNSFDKAKGLNKTNDSYLS